MRHLHGCATGDALPTVRPLPVLRGVRSSARPWQWGCRSLPLLPRANPIDRRQFCHRRRRDLQARMMSHQGSTEVDLLLVLQTGWRYDGCVWQACMAGAYGGCVCIDELAWRYWQPHRGSRDEGQPWCPSVGASMQASVQGMCSIRSIGARWAYRGRAQKGVGCWVRR